MIGGCVVMILSNEKKFIYLRVPKTGSTSASVFFFNQLPLEQSIIRSSDSSELVRAENSTVIPSEYYQNTHSFPGGVHATLDQVLASNLVQHPLHEYDVYAVCRNPLDRLLSFCSMFKKTDNVDILSNFPIFKSYMSMFECSAQSLWLTNKNTPVNKIFLYEDLNLMVDEIAKKYNVTNTSGFNTYQLRSYQKTHSHISKKVLEYIKIIWADDFDIYSSLLALKNKNY